METKNRIILHTLPKVLSKEIIQIFPDPTHIYGIKAIYLQYDILLHQHVLKWTIVFEVDSPFFVFNLKNTYCTVYYN